MNTFIRGCLSVMLTHIDYWVRPQWLAQRGNQWGDSTVMWKNRRLVARSRARLQKEVFVCQISGAVGGVFKPTCVSHVVLRSFWHFLCFCCTVRRFYSDIVAKAVLCVNQRSNPGQKWSKVLVRVPHKSRLDANVPHWSETKYRRLDVKHLLWLYLFISEWRSSGDEQPGTVTKPIYIEDITMLQFIL